MKVLLDTCVSGLLRHPLTEAGHDVVWTGDWDSDPGDEAILAFAHDENRIIVTLDKDFGTLAVHHAHRHSGILRLVNLSTREQMLVCPQILDRYATELSGRAIVTAERDRVRIRMPDD